MTRKMKDSGIEWIWSIPENWDVMFAFQCFDQVKNRNSGMIESNLLSLSYGKIKRKSIDTVEGLVPDNFENYNVIDKDNIVLRLTDLQNDHKSLRVGLAEEKGIITSAYITLRNKSTNLSEYLYYYLHAFDISKGFYGMGAGVRQGLNWEELKHLLILSPSLQEQSCIVDFLNHQCELIDDITEKTKASIAEYKKLRQAVITRAVTRGVRGNRPMKGSGVDWIEEIPTEWDVINPKALFAQRKDKAQPGEKQLTASQQHGIIYQDKYMEITGNRVVTVEKDFDILKHVEAGDFVISMRSFQGGLEYSTNTGSISSAYVMLIPNLKKVFPRYYKWLLKSSIYINALQSTSNMVRDGQAMRFSNFAKIRLITLPLKEQEEIADYLDYKTTEIDTLIAKKEHFLVELEKYKNSTIYEYVTGKKEA